MEVTSARNTNCLGRLNTNLVKVYCLYVKKTSVFVTSNHILPSELGLVVCPYSEGLLGKEASLMGKALTLLRLLFYIFLNSLLVTGNHIHPSEEGFGVCPYIEDPSGKGACDKKSQ